MCARCELSVFVLVVCVVQVQRMAQCRLPVSAALQHAPAGSAGYAALSETLREMDAFAAGCDAKSMDSIDRQALVDLALALGLTAHPSKPLTAANAEAAATAATAADASAPSAPPRIGTQPFALACTC